MLVELLMGYIFFNWEMINAFYFSPFALHSKDKMEQICFYSGVLLVNKGMHLSVPPCFGWEEGLWVVNVQYCSCDS